MPTTLRLSALACLLLYPLTTNAQEADQPEAPEAAPLEAPAPDQGYYVSLGVHFARLATLDDGEWVKGLNAAQGTLRLGQSLTPWFDLGLRIDYGRLLFEDRGGQLASLGLDVGLRPGGAWLLRLGVGMGAAGVGAAANSENDAGTFGALLALELGYSFFPFYEAGESGAFTITPILRLNSAQLGRDNAAYWASLGIEITLWMGRPRNQLKLSLEEAFPQETP